MLRDKRIDGFIRTSADLHDHLCPRQVLGVRIGMRAADVLQLDLPQSDKRVLTIVEADGCFADGVSAATGCWFGRRTMRLADYGKVAATFVDTETGRAVRIAPSENSRQLAPEYAPNAESRWHAYLEGYQVVPAELLLNVTPVRLIESIESIVSKPGLRALCSVCGEEIINAREVIVEGQIFCKSCAGPGYYRVDTNLNESI